MRFETPRIGIVVVPHDRAVRPQRPRFEDHAPAVVMHREVQPGAARRKGCWEFVTAQVLDVHIRLQASDRDLRTADLCCVT